MNNINFQNNHEEGEINVKFNRLINMMQIVCDVGDEDESGEGYRIALDEANKLKMELLNKYRKFISEEKLDLMIKKLKYWKMN